MALRGVYGRGSSTTHELMRQIGINAVTSAPDEQVLDELQADGMLGIVWLGAYNRRSTDPCAFERDETWIREKILPIAGHPAIAAYQITDEPDSSLGQCPRVVEQIQARAELVKSLDPEVPTYLTISKSGYTYERWRDVTDILGLVIYPVSVRGYDEDMIPTAISEADKDGVTRYWAVLQCFGTADWYVAPTAAELERQFDQWAASRMEGYVLFHWQLCALEQQRGLRDVIARVNRRTFHP